MLYYDLKTSGGAKKLPEVTDVLVAVPEGYPAALIDMPALHVESSLIPFVVGGNNPQNIVTVAGRDWRFLSFHPYSGDGAPNWNPHKHGFHDYYQRLYTWLNKI